MKTVKVETKKLLGILKDNRKQHKVDYEEALEGYREEVVVDLKRQLKRAKAGKDATFRHLPKPDDHITEYDRIIKMLELSSEDTVEMEEREFGMYVMDEWTWKEAFVRTSSMYNSKMA